MNTAEPVVVERTVSVPPDKVWPYVSQGEFWERWQGESCVLEPLVGGDFAMTMPDGAVASGTVVDVVPNERIVMTWGWAGAPFELPPGSTTVEIALTPLVTGGTRITVTHSNIPSELAEHHRMGWMASLDQLAQTANP